MKYSFSGKSKFVTSYVVKIAVFTLAAFVLASCFSPWESDESEGTFVINIGRGDGQAVDAEGRAVLPWDGATSIGDLTHTVTLSGGPGPDQIGSFAGEQVAHFSVLPGKWDISVEAHLNGELRASGTESVDIRPGPNGVVIIEMGPPGGYIAITFNSTGGSGIAEQNIARGGKVTEPQDPSRVGYDFIDWHSNAALSAPYDFSLPVEADLTLYAQWTAKPVTVWPNINGGTPLLASITGKFYDQTLGSELPSSGLTRSGFSFIGWSTIPGDGNAVNFYPDSTINVANGVDESTMTLTLYAVWASNTAMIIITVQQIEDISSPETVSSWTISRGISLPTIIPTSLNMTMQNAHLYSSIEWSIDGVGVYYGTKVTGNGATFTVSGTDVRYNSLGGHYVYLEAVKDGIRYSKTVLVTIVN